MALGKNFGHKERLIEYQKLCVSHVYILFDATTMNPLPNLNGAECNYYGSDKKKGYALFLGTMIRMAYAVSLYL